MSSTTLVSSYSSEDEEKETKKSADINYEQVTMDVSDGDSDNDMFPSRAEYAEYKAQFSSRNPKKGDKRSRSARKGDGSSKDEEGGLRKRRVGEEEPEGDVLIKQKRNEKTSGGKRQEKASRRDNTEERRGHKSHHRHRGHERGRHHHHRSDDDDDRRRQDDKDRRHPGERRHRDEHQRHWSSHREEKTFRKLNQLGMQNVSDELKAHSSSASASSCLSAAATAAAALTNSFAPSGAAKLTEQIERRKMLWAKKTPDDSHGQSSSATATSGTTSAPSGMSFNKWEETNFGDNAVNEKFRRLMGIKNTMNTTTTTTKTTKEVTASTTNISTSTATVQKDDGNAMFEEQEREYERARLATHTQRGVGLGFAPNTKNTFN